MSLDFQEWIGPLTAFVVVVALTVVTMQAVRKYDKKQILRPIRLLIVLIAASASSLVVFIAGFFPVNHLPLQIFASSMTAAIFHGYILHRIEEKLKQTPTEGK